MDIFRLLPFIAFLTLSTWLSAQNNYWSKIEANNFDNQLLTRNVEKGTIFHLDMTDFVAVTPDQGTQAKATISLPHFDKGMVDFRIWDAPIMEKGLAAKYPHIRTFLIQNISDPSEHGRLSITSNGLKAYITSPTEPYFIYPDSEEKSTYAVFKKEDRIKHDDFRCEVDHTESDPTEIIRLAVATTGEYSQFHGGSITSVLEAIVETVNEVNVAYENDFAIRFILINRNDELINLNASTDPFQNNNAGQMLSANPNFVNGVVGVGSYDIGHVFATGGAGLASLRASCNNARKASGITGIFPPEGSTFSIDYVAHELGHQLGSNHTFNSCPGLGQEAPSVAYEPGSGSTIMAYAGLCGGNNVQPGSDAYFHVSSLLQISSWLNTGGSTCAVQTDIENSIPTVDAGAGGFTIPIGTPFGLTAVADDEDEEDELTYCWEQFNLGTPSTLGNPLGNAPSFRSRKPSINPTRYFPSLATVVGNTFNKTEVLPENSRTFSFQCTVRDNKPGGGAVAWDAMSFQATDQAGPFVVTSQNENGIIWESNNQETVTWDVANTDQAPVDCQKVDIVLSTNFGLTFDFILAENVDNDGSASFIVPDEAISNFCRVMVRASDNVFYNINSRRFVIVEGVVSTRDLAFEKEISVYPNPSDGSFTLQMDDFQNQSTQVEVMDTTGKIYQNFELRSSTQAVDLPLPAGLYFLRITQDDRVGFKRVVINQ